MCGVLGGQPVQRRSAATAGAREEQVLSARIPSGPGPPGTGAGEAQVREHRGVTRLAGADEYDQR
ncbi:hypothetical protein [Pseudonocardia sp. N23]|uniref:hypothetical protein n=1 Tax=Pseudonocardia sp. N23 TaxID=1987376 RepID=UPI000BFB5378|nr:hypothetical protein [Pseudonocardia sp. N23]